MKNNNDKQNNTITPVDFEAAEERLDELERLLQLASDEASAEVDFASIRLRAIESASKRASRRAGYARAFGVSLCACASILVALTLASGLGLGRASSQAPIVDALASPTASPTNGEISTSRFPTRGGPTPDVNEGLLLKRIDTVAVSESGYERLSGEVGKLFPEDLPSTMTRSVNRDDASISAVGYASGGAQLYYAVTMHSEPPTELEIGEVWSVEKGESVDYYWQVTKANCIFVRFSGFERSEAETMFDMLAKRIVRLTEEEDAR